MARGLAFPAGLRNSGQESRFLTGPLPMVQLGRVIDECIEAMND
jgi:hypothetical protein